MATYLYCLLAPARPEALPKGLTGIAGSPVRALVSEGKERTEAWEATVEDAALGVSAHALLSQALLHNDVANAALGSGRTPAPARYGSRFDDDAACVADLARRSTVLRAILDRVAGAVEMSVLIVPADSVSETIAPAARPERHEIDAGRRYLEVVRDRARQAQGRRQAAESEAARIATALNGIVRGESRGFGAIGVMSLAHLVPRERVDTYRQRLAEFQPATGFRLVVGEPHAPYSFAVEESGLDGHDSSSPNSNE